MYYHAHTRGSVDCSFDHLLHEDLDPEVVFGLEHPDDDDQLFVHLSYTEAKQLLEQLRTAVAAVAAELGFDHPSSEGYVEGF